MTTMVTELYDALLDAGASDPKARAAAEALANYDDRFNRLDRQIDGVDRKIDQVAADLDRKIGQVDRKIDQVAADLDRKIGQVDRKIDQVAADLDRKIDQVAADLDRKIDQVYRKIDGVKNDLELQIAGLRSEVVLLKWMLGAIFALLIPIFLKQFVH